MKWTTYAYLVFSVLAVTLCGALSYWQYSKGIDAMDVEALTKIVHQSSPIPESEWLHSGSNSKSKVILHGQSCNPTVFLENRVYEGKNGYHVVRCFQTLENAYWVLMGWIPAPPNREELPDLPKNIQAIDRIIVSEFDIPNPAMFASMQGKLAEQQPETLVGQSAVRLQYFDLEALNKRLSFDSATTMKLESVIDPFYPIADKLTVPKSYKHFGYAVQWLLIAAAIVFIAYRGVKFNESK